MHIITGGDARGKTGVTQLFPQTKQGHPWQSTSTKATRSPIYTGLQGYDTRECHLSQPIILQNSFFFSVQVFEQIAFIL